MIPTTYTQRQVAELLKVSETTIRRERKEGRIKALLVRGKPVYTEEHVMEYIKAVER